MTVKTYLNWTSEDDAFHSAKASIFEVFVARKGVLSNGKLKFGETQAWAAIVSIRGPNPLEER